MYEDRSLHTLRRFLPLAAFAFVACGDNFGPGFWVAVPDTMALYSASRAEYVGFRSALNIASDPVSALPIEAPGVTGNWDLALSEDASGLVLVPAAAFDGLDSRARIATIDNVSFEDLDQAPRDTTEYTAQPVPVRAGEVYVIRSRRAGCGFTSGYRYAKLEPVEIDVAAGILRFAIIRNPICDDRSFVPPER